MRHEVVRSIIYKETHYPNVSLRFDPSSSSYLFCLKGSDIGIIAIVLKKSVLVRNGRIGDFEDVRGLLSREYRVKVRVAVVDTALAFRNIGLPAMTDYQGKISAWMPLPLRISETKEYK